MLAPLHTALIATGAAIATANQYRTRLFRNPLDLAAMILLVEMMAASGPPEPIEQELTAWESRLPMDARQSVVPLVRAMAAYEDGKLAECEQLCQKLGTLQIPALRFHVLVALKRSKEAAADPSFSKLWDDPWNTLSLSLGLGLDGQNDDAARWRERAISKLETLNPESRRAAKVLHGRQPAGMTELSRVIVGTENQALICAVLAERFPAKRKEYHAAARRYNMRRNPPYQLVAGESNVRPPRRDDRSGCGPRASAIRQFFPRPKARQEESLLIGSRQVSEVLAVVSDLHDQHQNIGAV